MFHNRLKVIRNENKLTQSKLAELLNTSRSSISMYERGDRDPDTETLIFLSNYFGVSSDWLLGLCEDRNKSDNKKNMHEDAYSDINLDLYSLTSEDLAKVKDYIELLIIKENSNFE